MTTFTLTLSMTQKMVFHSFFSSSSCLTFDFSSHITVPLQSSTCCSVILMSQIKLSFIKQDRRKGQQFHFQQSNRSNLLNTLNVFLL